MLGILRTTLLNLTGFDSGFETSMFHASELVGKGYFVIVVINTPTRSHSLGHPGNTAQYDNNNYHHAVYACVWWQLILEA